MDPTNDVVALLDDGQPAIRSLNCWNKNSTTTQPSTGLSDSHDNVPALVSTSESRLESSPCGTIDSTAQSPTFLVDKNDNSTDASNTITGSQLSLSVGEGV